MLVLFWFFFAKGEAERICHDYRLICLYRDFLPAFCMVSGRISFKTRKAGGKTLTVTEKKENYLLVLFAMNGYVVEEN